MIDLEAARRAKAVLTELLAADERIAGIGIAAAPEGGYQLKLNVREPTEGLPSEVDGVPVVSETVGEIHPL